MVKELKVCVSIISNSVGLSLVTTRGALHSQFKTDSKFILSLQQAVLTPLVTVGGLSSDWLPDSLTFCTLYSQEGGQRNQDSNSW